MESAALGKGTITSLSWRGVMTGINPDLQTVAQN